MNKRGFELDELNPIYIGLALCAGVIALIVMSQVKVNPVVKIVGALLSVGAAYVYLVATDN